MFVTGGIAVEATLSRFSEGSSTTSIPPRSRRSRRQSLSRKNIVYC